MSTSKKNTLEVYSRSGAIYQKKELIGFGSCASVFKYLNTRTNTEVAIKLYVYPKTYNNGWRSKLHQPESTLRQEIYLMSAIKHPHILECTDMYYRREYKSIDFGIVTDLATYDFSTYIQKILVSVDLRRKYMQQFLCAITFLHKCGYLHCDLKLENLLYYKSTGTLKLADFGLSLSKSSYTTKNLKISDIHCSPVSTRAPELLKYSALLKLEYKKFWETLPQGIDHILSSTELHTCECYSIGHILLELYLWREVEIFESSLLWTLNIDDRREWINIRFQCPDKVPDPELVDTIAALLDSNNETRYTQLDTIPWKIDVESIYITPKIISLPVEYKQDLLKGIQQLYIELVRRRERIYTLGQVMGLYHRILSDDPMLIFHSVKVAICCINLITIKRSGSIGEDRIVNENSDYVMELILQKFIRLNGIIYTNTIDMLNIKDSYIAWKSLTYYTDPELMQKYSSEEYVLSIPDSDISRIDYDSELLTYIQAYGELI